MHAGAAAPEPLLVNRMVAGNHPGLPVSCHCTVRSHAPGAGQSAWGVDLQQLQSWRLAMRRDLECRDWSEQSETACRALAVPAFTGKLVLLCLKLGRSQCGWNKLPPECYIGGRSCNVDMCQHQDAV